MRVAIYNPYLDTLGGGERYALAFATALSKLGHDVFVEWDKPSIKDQLENRFGVNLNKIAFIKNIKKGEGFDLTFWVSDGSIPLLRSRKNFIHFQYPFKNVEGKSLLNKMKMFRINKVICNSNFTKNVIDKEFGVSSVVLYPPVDVESFRPKVKKNIIVTVGRFSQLTQAKNQHVLVNIFKSMVNKGLINWELVLTGGTEVGANKYVEKLKKMILGYPIKIIESPSFNEIRTIVGNSRIFWSAVGYGIDEYKHPEKVEHFGIAVVEAMSAGCVPIVTNLGGYKETIQNGNNGFLWDKKSDLVNKTLETINNPKIFNQISKVAKESSQKYSYEEFNTHVQKIIQ